jgi:hypothetical protein
MPLIYRVVIEDEFIDMEEEEDTTNRKEVSFESDEVSHNLTRPPTGEPITSKSETFAAGEFRAIMAHKRFRTHIDKGDITAHDLHFLLDAFQSRPKLNMTIELQRYADEEDDIAAGVTEEQVRTQGSPRVTVAMLQFKAQIAHFTAAPDDNYEFDFQIIGGTEQEVFSAARNFVVPKPPSGSRRRKAR